MVLSHPTVLTFFGGYNPQFGASSLLYVRVLVGLTEMLIIYTGLLKSLSTALNLFTHVFSPSPLNTKRRPSD